MFSFPAPWSFNSWCPCKLAFPLELGSQVGLSPDHLSSWCLIQHTKDPSTMSAEPVGEITNLNWNLLHRPHQRKIRSSVKPTNFNLSRKLDRNRDRDYVGHKSAFSRKKWARKCSAEFISCRWQKWARLRSVKSSPTWLSTIVEVRRA